MSTPNQYYLLRPNVYFRVDWISNIYSPIFIVNKIKNDLPEANLLF